MTEKISLGVSISIRDYKKPLGKDTFKQKGVIEAAHVSTSQITHWTRNKLIVPYQIGRAHV